MIGWSLEYDEAKRQATLLKRGLDFADAELLFAGLTTTGVDDRYDYGEVRIVSVGVLRGDVAMVVWTQRRSRRRIISMRKCNAQERTDYFDEVADPDEAAPDAWDPDTPPPWTKKVFERAEIRHGDVLIRAATGTLTKPGRPKAAKPKRQVTLRLDPDVLDRFRATGPGWQTRINEALRKATI